MALTTQSATIGGATKTLIVAADGSSNIAAAHVTVDSAGAEKGITGNPVAVADASVVAAIVAAALTPPLPVTGITGSDGSGTITAGGTAQNLFAGATPTNGFEVINPDASEDLWVSLSTTAAPNASGSIRVAANGGAYSTPLGMKPWHAISIVGATTGHKFTAAKW